jgi:hypothetical protein
MRGQPSKIVGELTPFFGNSSDFEGRTFLA